MSPYEITRPGGSVEHWNDEPGRVWMARLLAQWPRSAWLNPVPRAHWGGTQSVGLLYEQMEGRMFPMTLAGLEQMIRALSR